MANALNEEKFEGEADGVCAGKGVNGAQREAERC